MAGNIGYLWASSFPTFPGNGHYVMQDGQYVFLVCERNNVPILHCLVQVSLSPNDIVSWFINKINMVFFGSVIPFIPQKSKESGKYETMHFTVLYIEL